MVNKKTPNPVDVHVGARIRMRRIMVGLSQERLGDGLGITFQQIQKYEKGTNRVGASRLQAISGILGVSPSYFFEGAENPDPSAPRVDDGAIGGINGFIASKEGLELNKAFVKITDAKIRKSIVGLVRTLADQSDDGEVTA